MMVDKIIVTDSDGVPLAGRELEAFKEEFAYWTVRCVMRAEFREELCRRLDIPWSMIERHAEIYGTILEHMAEQRRQSNEFIREMFADWAIPSEEGVYQWTFEYPKADDDGG